MLYSERDPVCEAKLFQQLMKLLGIKKLRATGYNAKANGLCKKLKGVVKQYLLKYTHFVGKQWDQWLREACYAYNSSVGSSTGFTPLVFGRLLRVPLDRLYGLTVTNNRFFAMKEFKEQISKIFDIANGRVNTRQVNSSIYHNKKIKDENLQVETLVYIYLPRNERRKGNS